MKQRKKLNSKTKSVKIPDYITKLLSLQFMETENIYHYGCSVFNLELYKNEIYTTKDGCFWGVSIKLDKIKSLEHGLTLLINMGYFPLLPSVGYIDCRYFNLYLIHGKFISHCEYNGKETNIMNNYDSDNRYIELYIRDIVQLPFDEDLFLNNRELYELNSDEYEYDTIIEITRGLLITRRQLHGYVENLTPIYTELDFRLARQNK